MSPTRRFQWRKDQVSRRCLTIIGEFPSRFLWLETFRPQLSVIKRTLSDTKRRKSLNSSGVARYSWHNNLGLLLTPMQDNTRSVTNHSALIFEPRNFNPLNHNSTQLKSSTFWSNQQSYSLMADDWTPSELAMSPDHSVSGQSWV